MVIEIDLGFRGTILLGIIVMGIIYWIIDKI